MATPLIAPTLTPSLPYDDARKAIEWLTTVLGFRVAELFDGPNRSVAFAQLVWRSGVIFVSSRPPEGNPWAGVGPCSIALAAEDAASVDRCYERALAAGADIVREVHHARTPAFPEGSHQFDVRDPGGHLWTVGTFQPRIVDVS